MKNLEDKNLTEAVKYLNQGNVLVLPSETSYGLSCDAKNQTAVDKIFQIKQRDPSKSLLIIVPTIAMAKQYLLWNKTIDRLARKYWPGPLTIVGEAQPYGKLAKGVISEEKTVAVRVSAHPILKYLSEKINSPLVSTSANLSGEGNIYSAKEIKNNFANQKYRPDVLFDAGVLRFSLPTTIVRVGSEEIKVLRQGEIKL